MTITHHQVTQGTPEWLELRRGMLTASEMGTLITPKTKKAAENEKTRSLLFELAAQRISGFVEPSFVSDDMERGTLDEATARRVYSEHTGNVVSQVGFITNDRHGFVLGYSPDGLVEADPYAERFGQIEIKSRRQKFQIETILDQQVPAEYVIQIQTGLIVTERAWCDFISFSGGLHMPIIRVFPDPKLQSAILDVGSNATARIRAMERDHATIVSANGWPMTERVDYGAGGEIEVSE